MNTSEMTQSGLGDESPANLDRKSFDRKKLAELGRRVIGTRSIAEFTEQTGLSRAFVSRLLNEKLVTPPKHNTLFRFAGPDSHPQGGVTADDMIAVCDAAAAASPEPHLASQASSLRKGDVYAFYFSPRPSLAMSLFLDELAERDLSKGYQLNWLPGGTVRIQTEDGDKKALILSAFCMEPSAQQTLIFSVLQRILLLVHDSKYENTPIYILTESQDMAARLQETLHPLVSRMPLCILRSSEDYMRIVQQISLSDDFDLPYNFTTT